MFHYTLPAACPHWTVSLSSLPQVTAPDQRFRSASPLYLAVERREREREIIILPAYNYSVVWTGYYLIIISFTIQSAC